MFNLKIYHGKIHKILRQMYDMNLIFKDILLSSSIVPTLDFSFGKCIVITTIDFHFTILCQSIIVLH